MPKTKRKTRKQLGRWMKAKAVKVIKRGRKLVLQVKT